MIRFMNHVMEQICYIWNNVDTSGLYGIEMYAGKIKQNRNDYQ